MVNYDIVEDLGHGFKCEYGEYKSADDSSYDDLTSLLQCKVLKLCGCGLPYNNIAYVANGLKLAGKLSELSGRSTYDNWVKECNEYFGNRNSAELFFYWVNSDGIELMEHGSSCPGHLTKKGKWFIDMVERAVEEDGEYYS